MPRDAPKRACDLCHRRKLKCDGAEPCDRCSRTSNTCTFLNPIRPKGPAPRKGPLDGVVVPVGVGVDYGLPQHTNAIAGPSHLGWTEPPTLDINAFAALSPFDAGTSMAGAASQLLQWQLPPVAPQPMVLSEDTSPMLTLTLESLIKPQLDVFFERVYTMIPIYTRDEIYARLDSPESAHDKPFIALILAMAALSLVHPLQPDEVPSKMTRAKQATMLLDESSRLTARWDLGCASTAEGCLTSYLMFGTLFELGYADGAKLRLQESISQGEAMRLHMSDSYARLTPNEAKRRMRLFWILAVTERAYALQRAGHLVFRGSINTEIPHLAITYPGAPAVPPEPLHSLKHLASVFSFIDQDVVACWNGEGALEPNKAASILQRLLCPDITTLGEVQRADLLITWQWLRCRIWNLAQADTGGFPELQPAYLLETAQQTAQMCRLLSFASMEAHGTGFVEKLYDIASLLSANLVSLPRHCIGDAVQTLQLLFFFVSRHRKGTQDYAEKLGEKVQSSVRLLAM